MNAPRCLLCEEPVVDDDALRAHLASVHDLEDDPGTESRLDDLDKIYLGGDDPADAFGGADPVPTARVHDPRADDDRWRPVTLGIGGLLLIVLAAVAMLTL